MFSICWSLIRKISCWTTGDFDHILTEGDNLYNSLNKNSFLSVDDLPRWVYIFRYIVNLEMKEENLHESVAFLGEPFLRNIFVLSHNVQDVWYLYAVMLLQLSNIQPLGIRHIFCLIRIVGIAGNHR